MFSRNGVPFFLSNAFNFTTKRAFHSYFHRSLSDFQDKCICVYVNKFRSSSSNGAGKRDPAKKPKPIDIIKDLDVLSDSPIGEKIVTNSAKRLGNDIKKRKTSSSGNSVDRTDSIKRLKSIDVIVDLEAANDLFDSVKDLSKDISNSGKFIKIMRCEANLDRTAVINTLEHYKYLKDKFIRSVKYKDEVRASPEFKKFLKALEENISNLKGHHLVSALSFIQWFGLSKDPDLFTLLTLRIIEEIDNLSLDDAILISSIIRIIDEEHNKEEDILINELSEKLKSRINISLTKRMDTFTELELCSVLKFLRNNDCEWSDEALIKLLNSCFSNTEVFKNERNAFGLIYFATSYLRDEYKKKEFQLKVILKLFDNILNDSSGKPTVLCTFARDYALLVCSGREEFDEKFYNSVMDSILNKKLTLNFMNQVVTVTILSRYIRKDVLNLIQRTLRKDMIYNDLHQYFRSRNDYFSFYRNCLDIFVCSEYQMSQDEWIRLKSNLKGHPILFNVREWKDVNEIRSLRLALSLAALDLFSNEILEYIFENIHLDEEKGDNPKNSLLIQLNQAAKLLNTDCPKSFLKESEILKFEDAHYEDRSFDQKNFRYLQDNVGEILKSLKLSFLPNVRTRLGHSIGFVIALNENNQCFNFKSLNSGEKLYLEDISVSSGFVLKLVVPFTDQYYSRNWLTLKSSAAVTVKTLNAMGYETVPILFDKWVNFSNEGKKKLLLSELKYRDNQ